MRLEEEGLVGVMSVMVVLEEEEIVGVSVSEVKLFVVGTIVGEISESIHKLIIMIIESCENFTKCM